MIVRRTNILALEPAFGDRDRVRFAGGQHPERSMHDLDPHPDPHVDLLAQHERLVADAGRLLDELETEEAGASLLDRAQQIAVELAATPAQTAGGALAQVRLGLRLLRLRVGASKPYADDAALLDVLANVAGINLVGSVAGWERWLAASAGYFFIWRLCVYAATAYGWFWMRRRVLAREDQSGTDGQARRRLIRRRRFPRITRVRSPVVRRRAGCMTSARRK